jgi:hypothetical protein
MALFESRNILRNLVLVGMKSTIGVIRIWELLAYHNKIKHGHNGTVTDVGGQIETVLPVKKDVRYCI